MRQLTDHRVGGLNEDLFIDVCDEPGAGGANHVYAISVGCNPGTDEGGSTQLCRIKFQTGPVKETGINGISGEALLAINIDRLRSFQAGPFACRENAVALTHLETALMWLQKRTQDRLRRGVEGRNEL